MKNTVKIEIKSIINDLGLKSSLGDKCTVFIAVDNKTHEVTGIKIGQVRNKMVYGYGDLGSA